jgi:hypothetical protein
MMLDSVGSRFFGTVLIRDTSGSAIVELAVTLTMLFTLLSGMVDLWKYCHEADLILTASRHGARAAAAKAQEGASANPAGSCDYTGGPSTVLDTGLLLASRYLKAVGLEKTVCTPSDAAPERNCNGADSLFSLTASFESVCEGGFAQRVIRLSITPKNPRTCWLCFGNLLPTAQIRASSVFAAEADCSAYTGTPAC